MVITSGMASMRKTVVCPGIVLLILLLSSTAVSAQTERGGIRGTVMDSTNAVIPGVTVTATHVETGVFRSTETTGEGIYNLAALPGGSYRVEVIHPGMRTEVRENVRVTAANVTSLSFTLEVGGAQESLVVTAETLLQADTSTTGASLDTTAYADLPLTSGGRSA